MEILLEDGKVCNDTNTVLEKWKSAFQDLLNPKEEDVGLHESNSLRVNDENIELDMNVSITHDEVKKAMYAMKNNKSSGIDDLPAEVVNHLHQIRGIRYNTEEFQ